MVNIYLAASQLGKYARLATSTSVNNCYISAYLGTASFYSCPVGRLDTLDRKVDRWYSQWMTNEWMAG